MKKFLKLFIVIALIAFVNPSIAKANQVDGLFRADNSITVNEKMEGTGFVAGNTVTVNNEVDGILFTAGNIVNVSGKSDYLFTAGNSVNISSSSFKDGFVAGADIKLDVNAERDLYVAGSSISLNGVVGRNLFATGDTVIIDGTINGDLYVDASSLVINSETKINGTLKYNEDAKTEISKDALIGAKETYKSTNVETNKIDTKALSGATIISKLLSTLVGLLNILVVGLLMVLLIPSLFNKLKEIEPNKLLPSFAWGLLILIVGPIFAIVCMLTYVGLSTGIILGILYGVLMYLGKIFSTYVITSLILKDKVKNPYLILLIGLPCLYIIKLIPFVGTLVSFVLLCIGLGLLTNIIKRK